MRKVERDRGKKMKKRNRESILCGKMRDEWTIRLATKSLNDGR